MKKIAYILKEMIYMIKRHKLAFLTPIFVILAILAILVYVIGPSVITTFIYAGV
ncbi:MAG: hypothetical protein GF375_04665 [Candidatus Omnitrophica bacterium]|nr:hypothetical protein [Candidatus Omnitrophota bacterium]MBD3269320.1 hypothetical protein [Candidatus Omnitrophota bacterium]